MIVKNFTLIVLALGLTFLSKAQFTDIITGIQDGGTFDFKNNTLYFKAYDSLPGPHVYRADISSTNPVIHKIYSNCNHVNGLVFSNNFLYVYRNNSNGGYVDVVLANNPSASIGSILASKSFTIDGNDCYRYYNGPYKSAIEVVDFSNIGSPSPYPYIAHVEISNNAGSIETSCPPAVYNGFVYFVFQDNSGNRFLGRTSISGGPYIFPQFDTVSQLSIGSDLVVEITFDNNNAYFATSTISRPLDSCSNVYLVNLNNSLPTTSIKVFSDIERIHGMKAHQGQLYMMQYDRLQRSYSSVFRKVPLAVLGKKQFIKNSVAKIYPTITHDQVHIDFNDGLTNHQIEVLNLQCQTVKKITSMSETDNISLSNLPNGAYIIIAYDKQHRPVWSKRIFKRQ